MKNKSIILLICVFSLNVYTQNYNTNSYFIGISLGSSYITLGDFKDDDVNNPDAGFANDGKKYDIYGGYLLNDRVILTGLFRFQTLETDIRNVVNTFKEANLGATYNGRSGDWKTYAFLFGAAYKVPLFKNFALYPRIGIGPLIVESPGLDIEASNGGAINNFSRSAETGFGLGYEFGVGLRRDLGKRFTLMPTFAFSGGWVTFSDVITMLNNLTTTNEFDTSIQSFNLGISVAYRF